MNTFLIRAVALALIAVPQVNVLWTDDALQVFDDADVSVAVATEGGLVTPVVRAAQAKSVQQLNDEIARLVAKAKAGRLSASEIEGGTSTLSNLGMYGVTEFSAILNPPQASILAVGAVHEVPAVLNGAIGIQSVIRCTMSVDHRAVDGAVAAQWISAFKALVEKPLSLLT